MFRGIYRGLNFSRYRSILLVVRAQIEDSFEVIDIGATSRVLSWRERYHLTKLAKELDPKEPELTEVKLAMWKFDVINGVVMLWNMERQESWSIRKELKLNKCKILRKECLSMKKIIEDQRKLWPAYGEAAKE